MLVLFVITVILLKVKIVSPSVKPVNAASEFALLGLRSPQEPHCQPVGTPCWIGSNQTPVKGFKQQNTEVLISSQAASTFSGKSRKVFLRDQWRIMEKAVFDVNTAGLDQGSHVAPDYGESVVRRGPGQNRPSVPWLGWTLRLPGKRSPESVGILPRCTFWQDAAEQPLEPEMMSPLGRRMLPRHAG